jgi:hypothetical protein
MAVEEPDPTDRFAWKPGDLQVVKRGGPDWAQAAATVSDRWPDLSLPPDDATHDDDWEFWQQVQALAGNGDSELTESVWDDLEHPRGRGGKWITSSLHKGEHYRGLEVKLPDLPQTITVGGERWEKVRNPHVTMFDSRRVKRATSITDEATLKQMANQVQNAPVSVTHIGPPWRIAEKGDRRSLVIPAKVEGASDLYDKLSEQAGEKIPVPPPHVTVYTAPGKKGIGLGLPEEWDKHTREPTAQEQGDLGRVTPLEQRGHEHSRVELTDAQAEARFEEMYRQAMSTGHGEHDARWYADAHNLIGQVAAKNNVDPAVLTAMVAATSPRMRWQWQTGPKAGKYENLEAALRAMKIARAHPNEDPNALAARLERPTMMRNSLKAALRLYRGENPDAVLSYPKTRSFYNNLAFPDQPTTVTVDTLMARALLGETARADYDKAGEIVIGSGKPTAKNSGYLWTANRVHAVADRVGLKPHELQAVVWTEQQRRQDADVEAETARRAAAAAKRRKT